jgi:hypothetical protein
MPKRTKRQSSRDASDQALLICPEYKLNMTAKKDVITGRNFSFPMLVTYYFLYLIITIMKVETMVPYKSKYINKLIQGSKHDIKIC